MCTKTRWKAFTHIYINLILGFDSAFRPQCKCIVLYIDVLITPCLHLVARLIHILAVRTDTPPTTQTVVQTVQLSVYMLLTIVKVLSGYRVSTTNWISEFDNVKYSEHIHTYIHKQTGSLQCGH